MDLYPGGIVYPAPIRKLESYDSQEKRLVRALRYEELNEDSVLAEIAQVNKDKDEDQERLNQLLSLQAQSADLNRAEAYLVDYCLRVKQNLNKLSFQDKRYALDAMDVQVIVWNDKAEIKASVPFEFGKLDHNTVHQITRKKVPNKIKV